MVDWYRSLNQGPDGGSPRYSMALFALKEFLKTTCGFPVVTSGDGLADFSGSGDILQHAGTGQFGLGNTDAHFTIEDPDGTRQWCFQHAPISGQPWRWITALVGPNKTRFSGGSATVRATSVDEVGMNGAQAPLGETTIVPTHNSYYHMVCSQEAISGVWQWALFGTSATTGNLQFVIGSIAFDVADAGDGDPSLSLHSEASTLNWADIDSGQKVGHYYDIGGVDEDWRGPLAMLVQNAAATIRLPGSTTVAPASGKYHTYRIPFFHYDNIKSLSAYKGEAFLGWTPRTTPPGPHSLNDVLVDQDGEAWVLLPNNAGPEGIILPGWDSTVLPLPDLGGGLTTTDIVMHGGPDPGAGPSTPPTITVVSPGAGQVLERNGVVTFEVTDPEGLRNTIVWVEIAGAWEVVWGGDASGFAPAYESSTRGAIANGYRYQVRRTGEWTASPRFHALAFDTEGNET